MLLQVLSPLPGVGGWCRQVGRRASEDWDKLLEPFPGFQAISHPDMLTCLCHRCCSPSPSCPGTSRPGSHSVP